MADSIAPRVAEGLLEESGLACIHITRQAARDQHSRLKIGDIGLRKGPGVRIWLKSRKQAERVRDEFFSSCKQAQRYADGLAVEADIGTVESMICESVRLLGYRPIDMDDLMSSLIERTEGAVNMMQKTGRMKLVNKAYAEERRIAKANGTPAPARYDHWLVARLKPQCAAFSSLTLSTEP